MTPDLPQASRWELRRARIGGRERGWQVWRDGSPISGLFDERSDAEAALAEFRNEASAMARTPAVATDEQNTGVPASPSGYSAEPEPISVVSAVPVSIPNASAMLPAISMWQPYASLMFVWDRERGEFAKAFETRSHKLPDHLIGEWVIIHATAKFAPDEFITPALNDLCYSMFGCGYNYSLPRGAAIGRVRFGVPVPTGELAPFQPETEIAAGDWTPGRWAWPVIEAELFAAPVPMKGRQGWWKIPASAIEARSDATGTGAAEGESAAPSGETPVASQPSSVATDEGVERVLLVDRIKQLRAERKHYFDVEGDGVDVLLCDIQDYFDRAAIQEGVGEHE